MKQDIVDRMIQAALRAADQLNIGITISIVDLGGHLIALRRTENSSFFGIDVSKKKAVTASQLRLPTHVLADLGQKIPDLQKAFDKDVNILTIAGGFPITIDGVLVGGLGISGGDFQQDKSIGEQALQAIQPGQ